MSAEASSPIKAVAYVRVSSAAQVQKGHGAESQAARCSEFARLKGYEIVRIFSDKAVSGSLIERPAMQELLQYLRRHKRDNVRVIIDNIARLARGLEAHLALRQAISSAGGVLESPSIEFGEDSDSQLMEHLLASVSQHARVKNAEQTRNRMEARIRNGYYPFAPPWGFKSVSVQGQGKVMVRDEPMAGIIQQAMEGYASGLYATKADVKRFFESQPDFPNTRHAPLRMKPWIVSSIVSSTLEWSSGPNGAFRFVQASMKGLSALQPLRRSKSGSRARPTRQRVPTSARTFHCVEASTVATAAVQ